MSNRLAQHLRANSIGYLALFLAVGGVAYGSDGPLAGQNTVGSADIINTEVQKQDIGDDAVGTAEVANESLGSHDISAGAFFLGDITRDTGGLFGNTFHLAHNAIQSIEIQDGQVRAADLGPGIIPAGPAGYSAFDDDTGIICNGGCTEGTLPNLPAGSYAISAKIQLEQNAVDYDTMVVECTLTAGGDSDTSSVGHTGQPAGGGNQGTLHIDSATLPMQVVHTFNANGASASVGCLDYDDGDVTGHRLKITAIRLGSLSNVHSSSG